MSSGGAEDQNYGAAIADHHDDAAKVAVEKNQPEEEETEQQPEFDCVREIFDIKWRVLVIICFLTFGGYWIYDFPGSLGTGPDHSIESRFLNHDKDYSSEMNQALYSVYSWPNTIVATIGGILIDSVIGLRKSLMLFVTLVTLGSIIFWLGVTFVSYPVMILGRFVFGLGNESLSVAQNSFVARYFRGKWGIALAFGIVLSFSRVGSSFNFLFSPRVAEGANVQTATLVGVFACCLSVAAALICVFTDLYAEKKGIVPVEKVKKADEGKSTSFSLKDFKQIEKRAWLIFVICITVYCSVFPFVGIGKNFFEVKYDVTQKEGATYLSFFQFACAGFSPVTGAIVDAIGRTAPFMILAGSGFTAVHLMFILFNPTPTAMTIFMGAVYSVLAASLWPAVPFVVAPSAVGLAYGLMNSLQNCGLAVYPLIVGAILDSQTPAKPPLEGVCANWTHSHFNRSMIPDVFPNGSLVNCTNNTDAPLPYLKGYEESAWLFMLTAFFGVLVGIALVFMDRGEDRILTAGAAERKVIYAKKIAQWKKEEAALGLVGTTPADGTTNEVSDEKAPLLVGNNDINASPPTSNRNLDQ